MTKNYHLLAERIVEKVGGVENILMATHCMTRLRLKLKDEGKANDDAIKNIDGVISVIHGSGQYQIVIGQDVANVYKALLKDFKIEGGGEVAADEGTKTDLSSDAGKRKLVDKVMDYITGTMTQMIPILIGAGLLYMIPVLGFRWFGMDNTGSTYAALIAFSNSGFYFLPIYTAFAAAKKLNCNQYMAAFIAAMFIHPSFISLCSTEAPTYFGIAFPTLGYASLIVPALLSTWVYSYVESFLQAKMPVFVRSTLVPFVSLVVMIPLYLFILGPVGYYIGSALVSVVMWVETHAGILAVPVLCVLLSPILMVGAHTLLVPVMISLITENGADGFVRPAFVISAFVNLGIALAVAVKTKNPKLKSVSFGAAVSQFFGIGEPVLYGVSLPLKKPFVASLIGSFIGGMIVTLFGCKAVALGSNGVWGILLFGDQIPTMAIACLLATIISFAICWIIGFDDSNY